MHDEFSFDGFRRSVKDKDTLGRRDAVTFKCGRGGRVKGLVARGAVAEKSESTA